MIKSMTGFGNAEAQTNSIEIVVEIKTLNSKFLDLTLRLPKLLNHKEIEIRNIISNELVRGKLAVSIQINENNSATKALTINKELFENNFQNLSELEKSTNRKFTDILKMALESPDVMSYNEVNALSEESYEDVKETILKAIRECNHFRTEEGITVATILKDYIVQIEKALDVIISLEPRRLVKIKEKLKTNIIELTESVNFDKDRLEQELIYYSEKLDINEEIERLKIHLNYFQDTISSEATSHGKKLGFITQEMGREINTLGSKANDSDIQEKVIIMKEELEKIKEQILNIL
ncbi:YicC family protein [Marivirga sp. S37H4]|uniref:YicC family protein n=1 Tax=Marivirga aurantiaca TaxID=2802615 RepID=A0A934X2Q6_9BACT|nr:YicC/YloC family endoribonuclease [Marivirga aurantiaca]MBK6267377.1 YicC family protein [Marivirga aurantiaca]